MKPVQFFKVLLLMFALNLTTQSSDAQFLMDMIDTSGQMGKGFLGIYHKFDKVRLSGYLQPQYQVASAEGISSFEGGDFNPNTNNRFTLRRGRFRIDYIHFSKNPTQPSVQLVFQFDGTERGFFTRDFWGRILENKWKKFGFTAGLFARPFGYETNLGSADRESPERGRMNQLLMRIERDIGAMISFEPRDKNAKLYRFKWDLGFFNGPGLTSSIGDYDKYKDLITRVGYNSFPVGKNLFLGGGISGLYGGIRQNVQYSFEPGTSNGNKVFVLDTSSENIGRKLPRRYVGADLQLKLIQPWGATELRGEFIMGKQTASANSTETPTSLPTENTISNAQYVRPFNGAYFYFLQNIVNPKHQLVIKYDWYDPNTEVKGTEIGKAGTNINAANIRYDTWGFGYNYYMTDNIRWLIYYALVKNEVTALPGYTADLPDNVLTLRLQFRF